MSSGKFSISDFPTIQQAQISFQQPKRLEEVMMPTGPALSNNYGYENGPAGVGRGRVGLRFRDRIQGDPNCIIFIGGLDSSIPDPAIREVFGAFGQITSLARKSRNAMQDSEYAFLAFQNPQQAQCAIQCHEIDVMGKRLSIKPRIRSSFHQNRMSPGPQIPASAPQQLQQLEYHRDTFNSHQGRVIKKKKQIQTPFGVETVGQAPQDSEFRRNQRGPILQNIYQPMKNSPQLLSKGLTVFNIPPDMSPYDLYHVFGGSEAVDGCYIYQWPDSYGRRYGHLLMKSFFFAQKAVENLNGFRAGEYTLDVIYKKDNDPFWFQGAEALVENPNQHIAPSNQVLYGAKGSPLTGEYPPSPFHHPGLGQQVQDPQFGSTVTAMQPPNDQDNSNHQNNAPPNFQGHGSGRGRPQYNVGQYYHSSAQAQFPQNTYPSQMITHEDYATQQYGMHPGYCAQFTPPSQRHFRNHAYPAPHQYMSMQTQFYGSIPQHGQYSGFIAAPYNGQFINGASFSNNETNTLHHSSPVNQVDVYARYGTPQMPEKGFEITNPRQSSEGSAEFMPHELKGTEPLAAEASHLGRPLSQVSAALTGKTFIAEPVDIPPAEEPEDPCNLFIKNLPNDITDAEELKALFGVFGNIVSVHLPLYEGSNSPRGYGFVSFSDAADAAKALEEMNMKTLGPKRLFVNYYEPKEKRSKRLAKLFNADSKGLETGYCPSQSASSGISTAEDKVADTQSSSSSLEVNVPNNGSVAAKHEPKNIQENVVVTSHIVQEPVVVTSAPAALTPKNMNIVNPFDGVTSTLNKEKTIANPTTDFEDEMYNNSENSSSMSHAVGRARSLPVIEENAEENTPKSSVLQDSTISENAGTTSAKKSGIMPAVPFGRNKSATGSPGSSKSKLPIPSPKSSTRSLPPMEAPTDTIPTPSTAKVRPSGTNQSSNGPRKSNKKKRNAGKAAETSTAS